MKKSIFINIVFALSLAILIYGCDPSKKVEEAREDVQEQREDLQEAQQNLEQAKRDSIEEFRRYRTSADERIAGYERDLAELRVKISKEKKSNRARMEKMADDLEARIETMKTNLREYKEDTRDDWETFKNDFNQTMDEIGQEISDFFTPDKDKK